MTAPIHPDRKLLGSDHILLPAALPQCASPDSTLFSIYHKFQFLPFSIFSWVPISSLHVVVAYQFINSYSCATKVSSPPSFMSFLRLRGVSFDDQYKNYCKEGHSEIKPLLALLRRYSQLCYGATSSETFGKQVWEEGLWETLSGASWSWLHLSIIWRERHWFCHSTTDDCRWMKFSWW